MTNRLLFVAALSLVAAPILAGCADNGGTGTPTPTTVTGTTPTPTGQTPTPATVQLPDDMTLRLGIMVPLTGALNNLGPDMRDAALLAVEQVNDAGIGLTVETFIEDDRTTDTAAAPGTFQRLVGQGVTAVVGPCCSGVTGAVLESAVNSEVIVATMSATSPALTAERENDGYFWRIVPNDNMQGRVLARLVSDDNIDSVVVLTMNNPYGNGLANVFSDAYDGNVVATVRYNEGAQEFSSAVTDVCGRNADGLVMIAYIDEAANILREMQSQGCRDRFSVYGPEGMYDPGLIENAGQGSGGEYLAAGVKGTAPAAARGTFAQQFQERYDRAPGLYAAESYDAVMYVVLGALAAQSVDAVEIRDKLRDIANAGTAKTKASDFLVAAPLAIAGTLDYEGAAHDFDFDEMHDPVGGIYDIWEVSAEGELEIVRSGVEA